MQLVTELLKRKWITSFLYFQKYIVIATVKPALLQPAQNYSHSALEVFEFNLIISKNS